MTFKYVNKYVNWIALERRKNMNRIKNNPIFHYSPEYVFLLIQRMLLLLSQVLVNKLQLLTIEISLKNIERFINIKIFAKI